MATIRAKMRVFTVGAPGTGTALVKLQSQYDPASADDTAVSAVFPSTGATLVIADAATVAAFQPGQLYDVVFTPSAAQPPSVLQAVKTPTPTPSVTG